ncbi:hypothetical protein JZO70_18375 [Enterococcus sp. 669A]|uniref:Bacterial Pleckstrin homology domain-containing protein n=1 Tax=Candidatus Enterococcus moelleringii TaxID=2815325 RepID=A0ABS3LGI8_9ENTE|nr:PH domain-containing protein [Enterococcus sp. 669A]MBO1308148.1 hypothetical protein [Enterococcus sp. 669A]
MNLIMWIILVSCNLILAFTLSLAAEPHNHVIIENTFPPSKLTDPQVTGLAKEYRRRQFQFALLVSAVEAVLLLPIRDFWFMLLFFMMLFLSIGTAYFLQIRYIRKMRQLIEDNHWQLEEAPVQINTQLVLKKNEKLVSWKWFILAVLLNGGMFFLTRSISGSFLIFLTILLVEALMVWGWYFVGRLPVRALTSNQEINRQYNDLTKYYWSFLMVVAGGLIPLMVYLPLLSMDLWQDQFALLTTLEVALLLFIVIFTFGWLMALRGKQDKLLAQAEDFRYQGDDYYWRYGIYYNPNDTRFLVPDRIGLNLTFNMATTSGKVMLGISGVILVVAMITSTVPMYILDYHPDPFVYSVDNQEVTLDGPFLRERQIPLDDIQQVSLVEELGRGVKTNGFATDQYAMGNFRLSGRASDLLVIKASQSILKIETSDRDYYFTSKKPQETEEAYREIEQVLK